MFSKNTHTLLRHVRTWLCLMAIAAAALTLLSACGSSSAASAAPSHTAISTPTVVQPTPSPTATQATSKPEHGTQMIFIMNGGGSYGFSPATLTIAVGTTVIWKNMSSAPHTVTTDDGQTADSGTIRVGGSYSFKFTSAGTFPYHCNIHPFMRATIIVV